MDGAEIQHDAENDQRQPATLQIYRRKVKKPAPAAAKLHQGQTEQGDDTRIQCGFCWRS
jgi:hypothetical protein